MSRDTPTVSVVVGTYNCAKYLPGLFACLDAQTFRDFEVVVVDDASTDDETLRMLTGQGDRIRLIPRAKNSATCELPRYQGAREAKAPLCAFLDADDRWDPDFLSRCIAWMHTHPNDALVHTYVRVVDGDDRTLRIRHEGAIPTGADVAPALLRHCFITISAVVARRDVWLAAVPESAITDFGMDLDFFLSIAKHHSIGFIPDVLAFSRRSDDSVSVKKWKRVPRNVTTLGRILRQGDYIGLATHAEMRGIVRDAYVDDAEYWRHEGRPERSWWFCREGLKNFPLDRRLMACAVKTFVSWLRRSRVSLPG